MTARRRLYWLALPILALVIAGLACGTGFSTSSTVYGLSGNIRAKLKEGNDVYTNSLEINEDWSRVRINASVTASVAEGSCRATLTGEENTSITLDVAAGSPAEASGYLVTDGFGEIELEADCQEAKELDVLINFTQQ